MALDWPSSPGNGQVYAPGPPSLGSWIWDGQKWNAATGAMITGFLPITGGLLSGPGNLTVDGNLAVNGTSTLTGLATANLLRAGGAGGVNFDGVTWAQINDAFGGLANSGAMGIGWNRSGGQGEVDFFVNHDGGDIGGLNIYSFPNSSGPITLISSLTSSGYLTVPDTVSTGGDLYLNRTNNSYGYIVRPNVAGAKNLGVCLNGGGSLDTFQIQANATSVSGTLWALGTLYIGGSGSIYFYDGGNGTIDCNGNFWASGNITAPGEIAGTHSLATSGYVWINGCYLSKANDDWLYSSANFRANDLQSNTNLNLLNGGTAWVGTLNVGGCTWVNNGGWMYTGNSLKCGDFYSNGNINTSGIIYMQSGNWYWTNDGGWMTCNPPLLSYSDVCANGALQCGGRGGPKWMNNSGIWTDNTVRSNGILPRWDQDGSSGVSGTAWGQCAAYWFNQQSDIRLKQDIEKPPDGALDAVMTLSPVQYRYRKTEPGIEPLDRDESDLSDEPLRRGFIAQEVRAVMGDTFGGWREENGIEGLSYSDLTAVLWQAVRELTIRLEAMEKANGSQL